MLCSNICKKSQTFEKPNNHSTRTQDTGHVLVWTCCSSAPQGHSVNTVLSTLPHSQQHSFTPWWEQSTPSWNKWLQHLTRWTPPIQCFLWALPWTAILETNSQPPIFKIKNPDLQTPQIYTKATLFPIGNHELHDKNKAVSYCYDWPINNQFTDSLVWRYCGIASTNMNFLSRALFDTISYKVSVFRKIYVL